MLPGLQRGMLTTSLTGPQWLASIGLALALPIVVEAGKWIRRRRAPAARTIDAQQAVAPARGLVESARR